MTQREDSTVGGHGTVLAACHSPTGHPQSHRRTQSHEVHVNVQPTPHPRCTASPTLLEDIVLSTTTQV